MVMPWLMWLLLAAAAVAVIVAAVRGPQSRARAGRGARAPLLIANSSGLLRHPQVLRRLRARRWLLAALACLSAGALVAAAVTAARPVDVSERNSALSNRDIVLCLDVSTSMVTTDARILETFSELLDTFDGERVALVAWNTTAQTMVPLTDDYELLRTQLAEISGVLDFDPYYGNPAIEDYYRTFSGTFGDGDQIFASSLVGDGLASCSLVFDRQVEDRSRSIILATDNIVQDLDGEQIYSLPEAADLAVEGDIRLLSIYGYDEEMLDPDLTAAELERTRAELEEVTTSRGGRFYEVDDPAAAEDIVQELEKDQAEEAAGDLQVRVTDTPETPVLILALGVLAVLGLAAWRRV